MFQSTDTVRVIDVFGARHYVSRNDYENSPLSVSKIPVRTKDGTPIERMMICIEQIAAILDDVLEQANGH